MSKLELPPVVVVDGDRSTDFVTRKVKCSETIELDASDSASPSGAKLSFSWFQYKEIGSTLPVVSGLLFVVCCSADCLARGCPHLRHARHRQHVQAQHHHAKDNRSLAGEVADGSREREGVSCDSGGDE